MRQAMQPQARPAARPPPVEPDPAAEGDYVDLYVAAAFGVVGALAAVFLPDGDLLRIVLVAPVALVVPGYLMIQAAVGRTPARRRWVHAALGLGLSPVVIGLAALLTALVPGGFRTLTIVAAVTFVCLASATVAIYRRQADPPADGPPGEVPVRGAPPAELARGHKR